MKRDKWVWMGHAGHFILGHRCRFHLSTYVGKYIVSTVGELWNDRLVREIHAKIYDKKWLSENIYLKGDIFDAAYFKKFGYEEVGCNRLFETMVFKAKKSENKCCPYEMISGEKDFEGYNTDEDAYKGHIELCTKWSKK
ncbi:hypothetical protein LCGC14_1716210 [marine sediment metagenome]|uniref:Uncharacterized protein n=1 Tax=marine sediment metagenome TaxID=412755 RepID=A0A0F9KDQ2_9ZZZZ